MSNIGKRLNLTVNIPGNQYPIYIENGLLNNIGTEIKKVYKNKKIAIVTDSNVDQLYGDRIEKNLIKENFAVKKIIIEPGEKSKSFKVLQEVCEEVLEFGLTRGDLIISFGGGVVGDLTGLVASLLFRGTPFIQIPTTLLAQIDSSIGGKVAVNSNKGKNLIGAFYQPKAVFIDPELLKTLSEKQFSDGMAEVIKYGAIKDEKLFNSLMEYESKDELFNNIEEIIHTCCNIKKIVVEQDEKDLGERMILNFGHTIGHGIEKYFNYEKYTHGEAVAIGMAAITKNSERMGISEKGTSELITKILKKYKLPYELPDMQENGLMDTVHLDKKNINNSMHVILLKKIGSCFIKKIDPWNVEKYIGNGNMGEEDLVDSIKIVPSSLEGKIRIPSSKSLCHRAIIAAGLSGGISEIKNVIYSDDIIATCSGMQDMGVNIDRKDDNITIKGNNFLNSIKNRIDCSESGSTLRFLIPLVLLTGEKVTFTGKGRLNKRPLTPYYKIFDEQNIKYNNRDGLPLTVEGVLNPGEYKVPGNISSQFITGLLFALPLLDGDSKIVVTTDLESKGYVDLTIDILNKFSVKIENNNYKEFYIKGNQKYNSVNYRVEGDFSQAAFWLAAGILGDEIQCEDMEIDSLQGDKVIVDIIQKMGGNIEIQNGKIKTSKSKTKGITIDASNCPDLVPILAVLASLSEGTTKIINAGRLRIKESDRLKAMATELNKLGADVIEMEDGLVINGKEKLVGGIVDSWNDHRIAMALSVASIRCTEPVVITNSSAIKKSYPDFYEDFVTLGGRINEWSLGQ